MRIATFATMAGLALLGTIVTAQSVTYDFDRSANFSKYKTYMWVPGTNPSDQLNHQRIGPRVGMRSGTATVEEIVVRTLAIDVTDARTKSGREGVKNYPGGGR